MLMMRRSPGLTEELFQEFPYWEVAGCNGRLEAGPSNKRRRILARSNRVVSCVQYRPFIELAADGLGIPLTARQVAALDLFDDCANDESLSLKFTLQPGQTLLLHNRTVLHARTEYEDWPEQNKRRHLLRTWIDAPNLLPVAPEHELGDIFGGCIGVD